MAFIASMNDDLLQNILLRLPAKPFAFASCVNRSWNIVCNRILSRPKMVSAFSRNPNQFEAVEEAIDKALSEPIRPDFVIANITCGNMEDTLSLITKRVGTRAPVIVSVVAGVLGKEACNDKAGEVKQNDQGMHICPSFAILLTIGYLPGIKVDVIHVIQSKEDTEATIGDKFVMDIRNFVSEVSDHAAPACLMLFGVMTENPESTSVDTPIVEALHIMHEGKFLHLPVTDKEGDVVAVVDVIHVTHAAVATAGTTAGIGNEETNTMMQKFWDSAMELSPNEEDEDTRSESSLKVASEAETGRSLPLANTFSFKIEDKNHRMHRFISDTRSLTEVITAILQRVGSDIDPDNLPQILYEDEDHDKVLLASDSDLQAAIDHAKSIGWKSLRLYLDDSKGGKGARRRKRATVSGEAMEYVHTDAWAAAYSGVAAGAALVAGLGFMAYLKRAGQLQGSFRVYICEHDTSPPEGQQIRTNQQNILIRSLSLKKQKGDSSSKKRPANKALDDRSSAKRPANVSRQEGSSSGTREKDFQSLTVEKLRALLKEKGLPTKGRKAR
ncbi:hypothetical protein F2Q68_00012529 [Brassica cretica]|uniref:PB1 domain-containing protein n=1 Tax=Brassica cretica TaxID=69181 RepID=A0A8S9KT73_BRACR|nr:hypothetical protein F2Q68_00012529 [Brassica cretica]